MIRSKNIAEIVSEVNRIIDTDMERFGDGPAEYYFRGEAKNYSQSTIFGTSFDSLLDRRGLAEYERELYEEALRYGVASFRDDTSMIERLARMQHYGLPTRFADLSNNALLSAHFAVEADQDADNRKCEKYDGYIRVIKIDKKRIKSYTSDIIVAISHLPLVDANTVNPGKQYGLGQLSYEIKKDLPCFCDERDWQDIGRQLREEIEHVWAFKPILNSDRIRNQGGIFLAFGCRNGKAPLHPSFSPSDYHDENSPSCGIKQIAYIQIAAEAKDKIRDELRRFGMSPFRIYPELSDVCKALDADFSQKIKECK